MTVTSVNLTKNKNPASTPLNGHFWLVAAGWENQTPETCTNNYLEVSSGYPCHFYSFKVLPTITLPWRQPLKYIFWFWFGFYIGQMPLNLLHSIRITLFYKCCCLWVLELKKHTCLPFLRQDFTVWHRLTSKGISFLDLLGAGITCVLHHTPRKCKFLILVTIRSWYLYSIYCCVLVTCFFFWQLCEVHTIYYLIYRWGNWGSRNLAHQNLASFFLFPSWWCGDIDQGYLVLDMLSRGKCSASEQHPQTIFLTTH